MEKYKKGIKNRVMIGKAYIVILVAFLEPPLHIYILNTLISTINAEQIFNSKELLSTINTVH